MNAELLKTLLPAMMQGLKITLNLFVLTLVMSIPLGLVLAVIRRSKNKAASKLVAAYVWLLRGTPLMLQLFFVYYGLPYLGITLGLPEQVTIPLFGLYITFSTKLALNPMTAGITAFVLNYAAYFAEIFRAGIESIDKGQYEGARALGYTSPQTFFKIILPQMARLTLPPVSNETITLIKDTALVSSISLMDLMRATQLRVAATANVTPFAIAAEFYLIMTLVITLLFKLLEGKFCKY